MLGNKTEINYEIKKNTIKSGKPISLIEPKKGDYMVATAQHFVGLLEAGYKINGSSLPHDRMGVMYIGKDGLSQCSWGSPAVTEGRAIHSDWPGEWKLGLTPMDVSAAIQETKKKEFDTLDIY